MKEFQEVIDDVCERYPQVEIYLKNRKMKNIVDLLKSSKEDAAKEKIELNVEEFQKALSEVDSQMKNLPATAQVIFIFNCSAHLTFFKEMHSIMSMCIGFRLLLSKVPTLLIALTAWMRLKRILKDL